MVQHRLHRLQAAAVAAITIVAGAFAVSAPAGAHGNACSVGSSNFVVIVYPNSGQDGTADDICWLNAHSYDDQFSVDEANVDDIGENANYHDSVSSMAVKNFGSSGLCVVYYQDAFQGVAKEIQWVGAGEGDIHFNAAVNDNYDSLDMDKVNQATCFS